LEGVPAVERGPRRFRLSASPGLAQGAAADDEIELADDGSFEVIERGGNLAVQVLVADRFDERLVGELIVQVEALGGRLDGGEDRLRVFTIPVSAGFAPVESVFNAFIARQSGAEWLFGNVYDPDDGITPLNWWAD